MVRIHSEQNTSIRTRALVAGLLLLGLLDLGPRPSLAFAAASTQAVATAAQVLTTFDEFNSLSTNAPSPLPVRIRGVVLCYDQAWNQLHIHDGKRAGYLNPQQVQHLQAMAPGQRIEVVGSAVLRNGTWMLTDLQLKLKEGGPLPPASPRRWPQLGLIEQAGQWVELRGQVRMAETSRGRLCLVFRDQNQRGLAFVMGTRASDPSKPWIGAEVRLLGVNDAARIQSPDGPALFVPSANEVRVLTPSRVELDQLPPQPIERLLSRPLGPWTNEIVHVRGMLDRLEPGNALTVRDATGSLRAYITQDTVLHLNTWVDIWGYLTVSPREIALQDAYFEELVSPGPKASVPEAGAGVIAQLPPITRVCDIVTLDKGVAAEHRPVRLMGIMTYADPPWRNGFFSDSTGSIYVDVTQPEVAAGQFVEIEGYTEPGGFTPQVRATTVRVRGVTNLPPAILVDVQGLAGGMLDCHWVEMEGVVRRAALIHGRARLDLTSPTGPFHAILPSIAGPNVLQLVDARISLRGACGTQLNARGQASRFTLHVPGTNCIRLLEPVPADPFAVAPIPVGRVGTYEATRALGHRLKVRGTVTLSLPEGGFFLQDDSAGIRVNTLQTNEVQRGDVLEVLGFQEVLDSSPCLQDAIFRPGGQTRALAPLRVTTESVLRSGTNDGSFIEIEADLIQYLHRSAKPKLLLQDQSTTFTAQLERPPADQTVPLYASGSRLRLRGVCLVQCNEERRPEGLRLLVANPQDIQVLQKPPSVVPRYLFVGGGGLLAGILAALAWIASLRLQVRKQTELIRQEKNLLATLLDHLPANVFVKDRQGRYLLTNRAHVQFHGAPSSEYFVGKSTADLVGPDLAQLYIEADRRVLEGGETLLDQEEPGRDKAGNPRWLATTKAPLRDETGRIIGLVGISRDITSRKEAESALRLSEERFRSVWEHSVDGMRLTDREGHMIDVNDAFCRLVKLPREKLLGQVFSITYKGHTSTDGIEVYIRRFDADEIPPRITARAEFWNSEQVDLEISSSFIRLGDQGKALLCIFRDVSERKRAEQRGAAFSNLAQRLSEAKTAVEAGEIIVDVADQLLGWDACSCDLYAAAEGVLKHVLAKDIIDGHRCECAPARDRQPPSPLARRAIESGGFLLLADAAGAKSAGGLPFGDTARPSASLLFVPIRHGSALIGVLSIQSYTPNHYSEQSLETLQALADHCGGALDRIQTEEALLTTQERLNNLLAQGPAMIYSLKTDGHHCQPTWVSHNVTRLLGYSLEEAYRPEWWSNYIHPADRDQVAAAATQLLRDNRVALEYRKQNQGGQYRWLRDEQQLVRDAVGHPVEIVGILIDITERKELEQQLRQSQKMEAIGQLAGGVAHDFNNLLAVIRGNSDLLLMASQAGRETREDCLRQIIGAAERAANLTRQLLTFSRKQVMQLKVVNLNDVVDNLTKMLKRIIGEDIELQYRYAARLPLVKADIGMLEQVLVNLVVNARDAMPRGGRLLVVTDTVSFGPAGSLTQPDAREGDFVCLSVTDTGEGITPEHLPRLFEPFFTTKEVGKGTGLGLATAYGIVKQHQGWIAVSSQLGQGSTFQIFLPVTAARADNAAAPAIAELKPQGGSETILLVEDDDSVRALTRRLLESHGYRVLEANCGPSALQVWNEHQSHVQLLLSDIIMPQGLTGLELAERLRTAEPKLRVVFLSGYSGQNDKRSADFRRQKHTVFLQKPCSSRDLLRAVRQMLDH